LNAPRPKVVFRTPRLVVTRLAGALRSRMRTVLTVNGKIEPVKSRDAKVLDDVARVLPAASWNTKFATLIKDASGRALTKLKTVTRGPLKRRLAELDASEQVVLVRAATRARQSGTDRTAAVNRVDGLIREVDFWHEFEPGRKTARAKEVEATLVARVEQHNKTSIEEWETDINYARRAYTPGSSPKNLPPGEVGDFIAFVYSKKSPKRIWILMIGNAKGASNAVALASKEGWYKPWSNEMVEGEFLGQADFDLERIPEFGLEIPGHGRFAPDRIRVGPKSTLRVGVVPPDISQAVRNRLENFANQSNKSETQFLLWDSRITSKESREAADELINILED
jgi:hypothetical protein